jgi:CHAD domain-containing protein
MTSLAVRRAFVRRLRALAAELPGALEDDEKALHRARVASRRLREILPVLGLDGEVEPDGASARRRVRGLTRALGGARELDVALGILDELAERHAALAATVNLVRHDLMDERLRVRASMAEELKDADSLGLPDELEAIAARVVPLSPSGWRRALAGRLAKRVDRLEEAVDEAGALYVAERLHQVRIAAKQLRYVLELAGEFGGVGTRRLTSRLKDMQDLLGRLHDLEFVLHRIRRQRWGAGSEDAANADRLQQAVDREIRERHADFLASVDTLREAVASCRTTVVPRLSAAPRPRARTPR